MRGYLPRERPPWSRSVSFSAISFDEHHWTVRRDMAIRGGLHQRQRGGTNLQFCFSAFFPRDGIEADIAGRAMPACFCPSHRLPPDLMNTGSWRMPETHGNTRFNDREEKAGGRFDQQAFGVGFCPRTIGGIRLKFAGKFLTAVTLSAALLLVLGLVLYDFGRPGPAEFVRAQGRHLVRNGEPIRFKSVSFSNYYSYRLGEAGFDLEKSKHHSEIDFERVRDLGFNSIRFAFNGNWYRSNPDAFWRWLDQNVGWAEKHGLLLTLDLHVPIGGFWLDPTDDKVDFGIWNDEYTRAQNVELWRLIAKRYRNETAVGAYELLNEAVTQDASGDQWRELASDLVKAIREVDPNHLLIVGALYGTNRRYSEMNADSQFLVDDPNVMYDFHFYEPIAFTHQSASWLERPISDGGIYPDDETPIPTGKEVLLPDSGIGSQNVAEGSSGWAKYDSGWAELRDPEAIAGLPVVTMRFGARGSVDFDDLNVFEFDTKRGIARKLLSAPLSESSIWQWWGWGNVDTAARQPVFTRSETDGANDRYSLRIEGITTHDEYLGWSSDSLWFQAVPGNLYKITGYMKGKDVSYPVSDGEPQEFVGLELSFYGNPKGEDSEGFVFRNHEYLEAQFLKRYRFGIENDVPMSVMEFGTIGRTFEIAGKGGGNWVRDLLGIFSKYETSFSLWNYHGSSMGVYRSGMGSEPAEPNEELIEILQKNLSKTQH
ncbi:glycoside hydrolase family 5 protein [Marimonas arenosa]|uniref:Glycoside hydrolase family 5 protein n=1 Tax=Marimonas arenosa TaxID=1795305 RepID=A0AAE4B5R1_9RHOB|nr:cellulase family glycosylhydrolase [Marimonas arenosa]MDQ2092283.1 glycoside hydrolase family 5 protein [Marimonas arenosa]